jgi:hypothetical protein
VSKADLLFEKRGFIVNWMEQSEKASIFRMNGKEHLFLPPLTLASSARRDAVRNLLGVALHTHRCEPHRFGHSP